MEKVTLQTESYLFENSKGQFRAIPFYECSIEECVVYEKGKPKYLIDFNRRQMPLVRDIKLKIENGETLEDVVWKLGIFLGKEWTTKHSIQGVEIPQSQKAEQIELFLLDDLAQLFIDLTFIATDSINFDILLNDEKFCETYISESELLLETTFIDNFENLLLMLTFIFKTEISLVKLTSNDEKEIFDLTDYKSTCLNQDEITNSYENWCNIVDRENTMTEYGQFSALLYYLNNNKDKKHLILITEKRKHWL